MNIDHLISRAEEAAWLASYKLGETWEQRKLAVDKAKKAPYRALVCYEAIIRSYKT
jgi:hypothetical protein